MFDVGFTELVVIGLVALIVIGPERLPKVARTGGILLGRLQRYVNDVKSDINREIQLDELKKMQTDVAAHVRDMEQSVAAQMRTVETQLNESIAAGIEEKATAPGTAALAETAATAPAGSAPVDSVPAAPAADKPQA